MHFEVQVRASAAASTTHFSDDLTLLDTLTWTHQDTVVVSIERQAAIGVLDFNQVAVASGVPTCRERPKAMKRQRRVIWLRQQGWLRGRYFGTLQPKKRS